MSIRVSCPNCGQHLRAPDNLAGGQVDCPRCGAAVLVPLPDLSPKETLARAAAQAAPPPAGGVTADLAHAPLGTRLGVVALVFGLAAVAVLCVPVVGYASAVLSGVGLLFGLGGLVFRTGGSSAASIPGRALPSPLAGTLVCLAALLLALLPYLFRPE
jgi:hypothetical protein